MNTTETLKATLKAMKRAEVGTLPTYSRLATLAKDNGEKDTADISEWVTAPVLVDAGFSEAEAEAVVFIMAQDVMGQPATSAENVSRFLTYCV